MRLLRVRTDSRRGRRSLRRQRRPVNGNSRPGDFTVLWTPAQISESQGPCSISADGKWLLYAQMRSGGDDLYLAPLDRPTEAKALMETPAREQEGRFSPDGRWIAYLSDESGRFELYVRRFPIGPDRIQVSNGGAAAGDAGGLKLIELKRLREHLSGDHAVERSAVLAVDCEALNRKRRSVDDDPSRFSGGGGRFVVDRGCPAGREQGRHVEARAREPDP